MTTAPHHSGAPSARTMLRRYHWLAQYDRDSINAILDAGLVCHVGYAIDGQPYVTPTNYWRIDDRVYWHGSAASRMLRAQSGAIPVCFTVTHLDGIVIARAAFNHNINFRSVMALGHAEVLAESDKRAALRTFCERIGRGLWESARQPTEKEWSATTVLRMQLDEVSAKVRTGPPIDDADDYSVQAWAGVIPLTVHVGTPIPDPALAATIAAPQCIADFKLE